MRHSRLVSQLTISRLLVTHKHSYPASPLSLLLTPPTPCSLYDVLRTEIKELPLERDYREVGDLAVWTVTSAKLGNGVEQLRDGRTDTYWQSDGLQPHLINVQFQKKARLHPLRHSD